MHSLFSPHNPFSENSDRRSQEGMRTFNEWKEPSGIRHFNKQSQLTGEEWICIEDIGGHLVAELSIGRQFPRLTLIKRSKDGRERERETYGFDRNTSIQHDITYAELKQFVAKGIESGTVVLISGSEEPRMQSDGSILVKSWECVFGEGGKSLGKRYTEEKHAYNGSLVSRTVGNRQTSFDGGPIALPLQTADISSGEPVETIKSVDWSDGSGNSVRLVEEGKTTSAWKTLKSKLSNWMKRP